MRKTNKRTMLTVAIVMVATVFTWKTYDSHKSAYESLLAENINALGDAIDKYESPGFLDKYDVKGDIKGKCIVFESQHNTCPERGTAPGKHGNNCEIVTYSANTVGFTYEKETVFAFMVMLYKQWKPEYGKCPGDSKEYRLDENPTPPASDHTYVE